MSFSEGRSTKQLLTLKLKLGGHLQKEGRKELEPEFKARNSGQHYKRSWYRQSGIKQLHSHTCRFCFCRHLSRQPITAPGQSRQLIQACHDLAVQRSWTMWTFKRLDQLDEGKRSDKKMYPLDFSPLHCTLIRQSECEQKIHLHQCAPARVNSLLLE